MVESKQKRALAILILLLLQLAIVWDPTLLPPAHADGSVDAQPVWAICKYSKFPDDYTGDTDGYNAEGYYRGSEINVTAEFAADGWQLEVYQTTAYIQKTDPENGDGVMGVYKRTGPGLLSTLFGQSDDESLWDDGFHTYTFDFNPDAKIDYGDYIFGIGVMAESVSGTVNVRYNVGVDVKGTHDGSQVWPDLDDPMTGESGVVRAFRVKAKLDANVTLSTSANNYSGSAENFTARRDITVNYPNGATSRGMSFLFPSAETLMNITYENEGGWDAALSGGEYTEEVHNSTHQIISIGDSSISSYGESFRLFTGSKAYIFTLSGPLYENSTAYGSYITVTAHLSGDTSQEFNVSGSPVIKGWDTQVLLFTWAMPGGGTRLFYPMASGESISVYLPEDDYGIYSFDIKDYSQKVGTQNSWLEVHRFISGSDELIERHLIQNVLTDVPAFLVIDQAYLLRAILSDDSVQSFGFFVAGMETEPILIIQLVTFSDQVQNSQAYVMFEATRSEDGETIQGEFENVGNNTSYLIFQVRLLDDTLIYDDDLVDTNEALFQWTLADNETDYYVWMRCVTPPTYVSNVTYVKALPRVPQALEGWNMSTISSSSRSDFIPFCILLGAASLAGAAYLVPGLIITVILATTFTRWGWLSINGSLIGGAICFIIILALGRLKREYGM